MGRIRATSEWEDREEAVKQRLRSYRILISRHEACSDLFERLQPALTAQITCDRVMSLGENRIEEKMHTRIDLERQMGESLQAMLDDISGILKLIEVLEGYEHTVILRRYTLNESMEAISERIHMSVRHCWQLHQSAIRRLSIADQ